MSTPWKVFQGTDLIAATAYPGEAAVLCWDSPSRTVKFNHRTVVWKGIEEEPWARANLYQADFTNAAVEVMLARLAAYWAAAAERSKKADERDNEYRKRIGKGIEP